MTTSKVKPDPDPDWSKAIRRVNWRFDNAYWGMPALLFGLVSIVALGYGLWQGGLVITRALGDAAAWFWAGLAIVVSLVFFVCMAFLPHDEVDQ